MHAVIRGGFVLEWLGDDRLLVERVASINLIVRLGIVIRRPCARAISARLALLVLLLSSEPDARSAVEPNRARSAGASGQGERCRSPFLVEPLTGPLAQLRWSEEGAMEDSRLGQSSRSAGCGLTVTVFFRYHVVVV